MWRKLVLLSLYLMVLFILSRILEGAFWFSGHRYIFTPNSLIDPLSISVSSLRQLLDSRGISYSTAIEKQDLTNLLVTSGQVTQQELQESEKSENLSKGSLSHQTVHFTGGSHFYEEVEDTKDSVWLVQVVANDNQTPLLDAHTWKYVVNHVSRFGVRTGVFKCSLDRRLCARKSWTSPLLILALPRGQRTKEDVVLHNYQFSSKPQSVLKWIRQNLSTRVAKIQSFDELKMDWLSLNRSHGETPLRVILLSTLDEPPLFLSSLAIKFTSRAQFGMMSTDGISSSSLKSLTGDSTNPKNYPAYIIATPENVYKYGDKVGEILNFRWMELHLKSLHPEVNDIFLVTLFLLNVAIGLEFFLVTGKLWRHCVRWLLRLVNCNCLFFLFWLLLLGAHHFQIVHSFTSLCLKLLRLVSESGVATMLKNDWQYLYSARFFAVSFFAFGLSVLCIWKKLGYGNDQDGALFSDWWFVPWDSYLMNYFFRPMATLTRPMAPQDMDIEEGLELFIEHLAVPNLWLLPVPVIEIEYLKDLPIWKYSITEEDSQSQDEKRNYSEMQSSSDDEFGQAKDKKNKQLSCFYSVRELLSKKYRDGEKDRDSASCSNSKKIKKSGIVQKAGDLRRCLSRFSRKKGVKSNSGTASVNSTSQNVDLSGGIGNNSSSSAAFQVHHGMMECRDCSICLEVYNPGDDVCGLPCGHVFHHTCIILWLSRDNHVCPICRWPSFKPNLRTMPPHLHSQ